MAAFIERTEGEYVSHHYVAKLWRQTRLKPHRQGTFKVSKDPAFAEKVADIVGLYLDPPTGAIILSVDEKTRVQTLDRTQPLLPIAFDATAKRHPRLRRTRHDKPVRRVGRRDRGSLRRVPGPAATATPSWRSSRRPVKPHAREEIHVVLDNLSTLTTPDVKAWLEKNPNVQFHFTPVGSFWINQIETWFGIITRQAIRRGTFSSVKVLIKRIHDYIAEWNSNAEPFVWTATADEILGKVRLVQSNIKKLLDNNAK